MTGLAEVFTRLADDVAFADQLRSNPTEALRGYHLSSEELDRLTRALDASTGTGPSLFERPSVDR